MLVGSFDENPVQFCGIFYRVRSIDAKPLLNKQEALCRCRALCLSVSSLWAVHLGLLNRNVAVFSVELFWREDGAVIVNEVAPRPHNSGHYSIEACQTSQFEQHLRAILGWPLGDPSLQAGCAIMYNVLGQADGLDGLKQAQELMARARSLRGAHIHWYGKEEVRKNRKVWDLSRPFPLI